MLPIQKDTFQFSRAYRDYKIYRELRDQFKSSIKENESVSPTTISNLIKSNPDYWEAYYIAGTYYYKKGYLNTVYYKIDKKNCFLFFIY